MTVFKLLYDSITKVRRGVFSFSILFLHVSISNYIPNFRSKSFVLWADY
jgi:hypothetical protein